MKRICMLICFFLIKSNLIFSQTNQGLIEKSVWGVQVGFPGFWVHNESRISEKFALRSEAGLDMGFWGSDFYDNTGFLLTPVITIEPRFYYNIYKRGEQRKWTKSNSANFITLKTSYHPDWFVLSNQKDFSVLQDLSVIPTWGMRRSIGKSNFNYETGMGIGYRYIFAKSAGYLANESKVAANLHLRIGYTF